MSKQLDKVVAAAVEQGLLAAAQAPSEHGARPWPVLVLTAVAAWFAAIPLGAVLGFFAFSGTDDAERAFTLAVPVLGLAVLMLRTWKSLFLEQLAISGLIIGVALVAYGLNEMRMEAGSVGGAAALTFVLAFLVPQAWLRVLLGAAGTWVASEAVKKFSENHEMLYDLPPVWIWQLLTVCWLASHAVLARQARQPGSVSRAAALEAVLAGSGAMIVVMLARAAGGTFLVSANLPGQFWEFARTYGTHAALSVVFGLLGAGWMARQWPSLRSAWFVATSAIAVPLCWLIEPFGALLCIAAYTVASGRQRLAVLAGAAALWVVGATYYQLHWPLVYKGTLLIGCGLAYAAMARFALPAQRAPAPLAVPAQEPVAPPAPDTAWKRRTLAGAGLAVLALANVLIWQKEALIRHGQPVFVELAPVDPRSLLQGDYMSLFFALPEGLDYSESRRVVLVARRAPNGVVTLLGPHGGKPLAANELLIEAVRKGRWWTIATDAWYFAEGDADHWAPARYGEFRVDATGKALLVGLRGKKLEPL